MIPVVDVHAHIFNARSIPIKGYLLSRKYEGIIGYLAPILIPAVAKCIRRRLKKRNFLFDALCCLVLKIVYLAMGNGYQRWSETLSKEVTDITVEMLETFQKDEIDLFVPLMIDYEYWFRNTYDTQIKEQIDFIFKNIILPYKGKIHPFVAFDPARELAYRKDMNNPDDEKERFGSLNLVKDAIENKGFIGVKLYNAMGYKPLNNVTVEDKRRQIALHGRRYMFKGEDYDKVLSELYDYCIENEVPITTHCGMEGSEAYPDASFDFGQAVFWRYVLDQKKYQNLRLNLAHFGWNKTQGMKGPRSWVKEISEMVSKYKNLYTDVSHHEVTLPENKLKFKSAYQELVTDYPAIKKKLLFGIDWHVIKRVNYFEDFKESYLDILKHELLFTDGEIKDFLGGNALRFLGLLPGRKNRQRLEIFYRNHKITPPLWFKSLDK